MSKAIIIRVTTYNYNADHSRGVTERRHYVGEDPKKVLEAAITSIPTAWRQEMRQKLRTVVEGEREISDYLVTPNATITMVVEPVEVVS